MNAWIIYDRGDYEKNAAFADMFIREGKRCGVNIVTVLTENIIFGCRGGVPFFRSANADIAPDFVISRQRSYLLSRQLELCGVPVFNNSEVCRICNNKLLTHQYLSAHGVDMLDTVYIPSGSQAMLEAASLEVEYPCVIKPASGHGGDRVMLAATRQELLSAARDIFPDDIVLQRAASDIGRDMRVYAVGGKIIAAVLRDSGGAFRSNFSLGGGASVYELSEKQRTAAEKIISLFDFGLAGIDFLFDNGRFVLSEIEDVVGCRMLYSCTDINIVRLYLEYIIGRFSGAAADKICHN